MLGALIAWEYEDADLRAEHFLTVAGYNLQHPAQFTEAALAELHAVFVDHCDNGVPVADIRRRVGKAVQGSRRVFKPVAERQPKRRRWAMTIADVYRNGEASGAARRVREWAGAIRSDL